MAEEGEAAAEVVVAVDNLSTSEPSLPSLPSWYDMLPSNPTYKDVRPNVAIVPIFRITIGSAIGINHVVPCRASLFVSSEPMWKLQNPFILPSSSSRHSSTPRTFPAFPGPVPPCTHTLRLKLRPTEAKMDRPCRRPPPRCEGAPLSTRCGVGPAASAASFSDKEGGDDDDDEDDEEDEDEDNDVGDDGDGDDDGDDESTASLRVPVAPPTSSSAPPVGPVNTTDHPRDGCPSCPARGQYGCGAPGTVPGASGTEGVPSLPRSKDTQGQCRVCPPPTASWKMPPPAPPEPPAATPTAALSSSVQNPRGFGRSESAWVLDHAASPAGVPLALALFVVVVGVVGVRRPLVEVEVAAAAAAAASRADGRR